MKKHWTVLFITGIGWFQWQGAYPATRLGVFEETTRPSSFSAEHPVKRDRFVKLNEGFLERIPPGHFRPGAGPTLHLNLFDDAGFNLVLDRPEIRPGGRTVFSGHVQKFPGSMAVLTRGTGTLTGLVFVPGRGMFKILPAGNGLHRIVETHPDKGFRCALDGSRPGPHRAQAGLPQEGIPYLVPLNYPAGCSLAAPAPVVIDLMAVYTPEALSQVGGVPAMGSLLDTLVAFNNLVFYNSGVNAQLRLVYSGPTTYTESGSFVEDLNRLGAPSDGFMDEVTGLQDAYGADLVCLFSAGATFPAGAVGIANEPGNHSVVTAMCGEAMFHELGHNFGCGHEPSAGGPGIFPYSSAHSFTAAGGNYHTVMSYAGGAMVPYFSSPLVSFQGVPTGTSTRDNARTINETAADTAATRATSAANILPVVSLTSPADGSVFPAPATLALTASASDADGTVRQVDFYADGLYLGTALSPPYAVEWPLAPSGDHFLTAHAIDDEGAIKFSCPVSIHVDPALPAPWEDQDIGWLIQGGAKVPPYMGLFGSGSYSNGVFSVNGSGAGVGLDIVGQEQDSFQFVHRPSCGDGTLTARLVSLDNGGDDAQAGIMFRDNLLPVSPYVFLGRVMDFGTFERKVRMIYRPSQGGGSSLSYWSYSGLPVWLRLQRSGDSFTGYVSSDGVSWALLGSVTVPMGPDAPMGFAVSDTRNVSLASALFDSVEAAMSCMSPTATPVFTPTRTSTPAPTPTHPPAGCCPDGNAVIETFAGSGAIGYSGDGGPATQASFGLTGCAGIAADSSGNLYVCDPDNRAVRKVAPDGTITTAAGHSYPVFIAADSASNLYVSGYLYSYNVQKIDASGHAVNFAGNGTAGYSGDGGPATAASLNWTGGLALDPAGSVLIADSRNHAIRKVSPAGIITTIAGNGTAGFSGDGGPATAALLNEPGALAVSADGDIYFSDSLNYRIRKIDAGGTITTLAGTGSPGFSGGGGPATLAAITGAGGTALCGGNVYFSDRENRIRMVDPAGTIRTICGTGAPVNAGDGGAAMLASLMHPGGLCFDAFGGLYVGTGSSGGRVRKLTADCLPPAMTATPTPTQTHTVTPTPSSTPSATVTSTATPSLTATHSPTATPTDSMTATPSASPTATATSTCTPPADTVLYPDPIYDPGPVTLHIGLTAGRNDIGIKIYTVAFRMVGEKVFSQLQAGVYDLPIELEDRWGKPLANGLYYVAVTVNGRRMILKLLVLR